MAEKLGMTQAGYSKIESGATKLSYSKIVSQKYLM
ncbi:helix-turn-helix domain-containing protein [Myroides pelagicus]